MKTLKFRGRLVDDILSGEKTATWRMFDDKDLKIGDELEFINTDTEKVFAKGKITRVREKKLRDLNKEDFVGNGEYLTPEENLAIHKEHYGNKAALDSILKMIDFEVI